MKFEWDEAKNRSNIRKHGLDFADAEEMFRGSLVADPDTSEDYGEKRWAAVGMSRGCVLLAYSPSRPRQRPDHFIKKGNSP